MIQPVLNNLLVEVDFEWKSEVKTESGVVGVIFENDIDRSQGAQRKGIVKAVPRGISKHHYLDLVDTEVKVGDTIYFHFNSITPASAIDFNFSQKEKLYSVPLDQVFVIVRDGEVIMFGDRVLCEEIIEEDVLLLEDGMRVKKTASGIITEINVGHDAKRAKLAHIGPPIVGANPLGLVAGDIVVYDRDADFENEIEGKKYFCMIADDLLMQD